MKFFLYFFMQRVRFLVYIGVVAVSAPFWALLVVCILLGIYASHGGIGPTTGNR